jgi:cellulose synthase/poly-beta-1,6-N-acetylglucosamine synthase-like glycosyltransferase
MSGWPILTVSYLVAAALICFSIRRLVLLGAAVLPRRPPPATAHVPSVTLVTAARNEGRHVEHLLAALDRLEYPPESLFTVLVNDCSSDDTGERLAGWAAGRERALVIDLERRVAKSAALNEGIAAAPDSDLIAVCDADMRPRPDWLRKLARSFTDPTAGSASGPLLPRNADASPVARYAAVESWVHQLVTSAGKDRLDLNPPAHGAAVYRREALDGIGRFAAGEPGDDVQATMALTVNGWRTRFIPDAVAENTVAEGLREYWQQHVRWARNVWAAGVVRRGGRRKLPARRRLEAALSSLGYADRLVFACAVGLAVAGELTPWLPVAYLGVAVVEVVVAVAKAEGLRRAPGFVLSAVVLFPVDVLATAAASAAHLRRRPLAWRTNSREPVSSSETAF